MRVLATRGWGLVVIGVIARLSQSFENEPCHTMDNAVQLTLPIGVAAKRSYWCLGIERGHKKFISKVDVHECGAGATSGCQKGSGQYTCLIESQA